ncbi:ABC transporter permease [Proteiniclasticum sp.]|uniref:ABC transporter permease n=1 Tax=Proteiniclasticum sp. TaxID=2053595 RepID=UPI002898E6B0|nr:ABC transporter permease [Proteiniclasticum sp.]
MKLLMKLVHNDLKRNRVITTALALFIMMSVLFMAGGLRVTGTMISSMKGLEEIARPPDYLQMHKGEYDEAEFMRFAENQESVEDAIIVKMLTVRNANIIFKDGTLESSLMDNSFVVQNEGFDFLLSTSQEIASVKEGQIGVPVYYAEDFGIETGDILTLKEGEYRKDFTVSHIIRDSSMNAALSSSKRFLISQPDLNDLSGHMGDWEYLFEFRIRDGSSTSSLEKDYLNAGLPSNGVALTGSQLRIINNLSFGLVAFIIISISILLILIAMLCLSYIIRATMAEENRSIGEMKAIGFSDRSILKLYLMKYIFLVIAAGIIGYLAAIPFGNYFSSSVIQYCGIGSNRWMSWIFPLVGVAVLGITVILRCRKIIRKNLRLSVVELLRGKESMRKEGHFKLPRQGLRFKNLSIALGELKCKWKEYIVLFFVFLFSSFLILLPMNMKNTVENASFMTYMGVGESDIRIDIQFTDQLTEERDKALLHLEKDPDITKYSVYQNGYVEYENQEGDWEYLRVENGDGSVFPLEYMDGHAPDQSEEIAVSSLYASESGMDIGDSMKVGYREEVREFRISGIYQDVTYGGRTAKADIDFDEKEY